MAGVEPLGVLISFSGGGGVKAGSRPDEISHPRKASFCGFDTKCYPARLVGDGRRLTWHLLPS